MGDINNRDTEALSGLVVYDINLGVPGGRRASAASMLASCGTSVSLGVRHPGSLTTVSGIWLSGVSLAKARIFLSSAIVLAKDGATNWVTHSTLVCGSGESNHTITRGLSPNGKVTIISSLFLGLVSFLASRRVKMDGKPSSAGLGDVAATLAPVSLIVLRFWGLAVLGCRAGLEK